MISQRRWGYLVLYLSGEKSIFSYSLSCIRRRHCVVGVRTDRLDPPARIAVDYSFQPAGAFFRQCDRFHSAALFFPLRFQRLGRPVFHILFSADRNQRRHAHLLLSIE